MTFPSLELFFQHPHSGPESRAPMGPYLICGPSTFSATARWIAFRDKTLVPMIAHHPDDVFLRDYLRQIEKILRWRAGIPPEQRFWNADETFSPG